MRKLLIISLSIFIICSIISCNEPDIPPFQYEEFDSGEHYETRGVLDGCWGWHSGDLKNDFLPQHNLSNGNPPPEIFDFRVLKIGNGRFEDWIIDKEYPEGILYTSGIAKALRSKELYILILDDNPTDTIIVSYNIDSNGKVKSISSEFTNGDSVSIQNYKHYLERFEYNFRCQFDDVRGEIPKGSSGYDVWYYQYPVSSTLDIYVDNGNGVFNKSLRESLPYSDLGYGFYSYFEFNENKQFDNYLIIQVFEFISAIFDDRIKHTDMIWYFKINSVHDGMMELTQCTALDGDSIGKARIIFPEEPIEPLLPY